MTAEPIDSFLALRDLSALLVSCEVPYLIGGSLASSVQGHFRNTNDIDIVCHFSPDSLEHFLSAAQRCFIVDAVGFRQAFAQRRSFNVIHEATFTKIDCFLRIGVFERCQLERAVDIQLPGQDFSLRIATAEDIILAKLLWYKAGGEQSERQLQDIRGVMKVQGQKLDRKYLETWAQTLEVSDLLKQEWVPLP